jgi:tetratricopeptide (TPR) repeat protein
MQVNQFIHFLDYSSELSSVSESEISVILKEFPYCQTGQLMSAIHLNLNNSILFEGQLKRASAICSDRSRLFEHIHQVQNDAVVAIPKDGEKVVKESVTEINIAPLTNEKLTEEVQLITEIKEEEKTEEKLGLVAEDDELSLLEKEYLSTAISNSILLEAVKSFDEGLTHSFSSWVNHYNENEHVENISLTVKNDGRKDIIERFIQEDPRIKPKKTKFYSPTNMARISVTDSGIVSETLALIHVDQGSFQEAIDTYEKLMLKNPKKKSYFAAQIKILKQKLK